MKASVVIPTYNCAHFLPHAVKSVQDQTYKDWEIVIVDDCSTDSTGEYLEWLKKTEPKAKIIRNPENKGRSYSRNLGNQEASGDVIFVLDADDLCVINRIDLTLKKMKKSGAKIVYGSAVAMDAFGSVSHELNAIPIDAEACLKKRENGIVHSSMAYTKEIALKYPYADGKICSLGLDDWEQQVRMMKAGEKFHMIPDVLCAWRMNDEGISHTRDPKEVMKIKEEILGDR